MIPSGPAEVIIAERVDCVIILRMKKPKLAKLAIRREFIRTIATLELARVIGGDAALVEPSFTCKVQCNTGTVNLPAGG